MKPCIGFLALVGMIWAADYMGRFGELVARTPSSGITQVLVASGIFEPFNVKRTRDNWDLRNENTVDARWTSAGRHGPQRA